MDTGNLIYLIKNGGVNYNVGDEVYCFRRNSKGHPRRIKDDATYIIKSIHYDDLFIANHSLDGIGWNSQIKVHKSYMISKSSFREIKINEILK
jgi:hypothetical protein